MPEENQTVIDNILIIKGRLKSAEQNLFGQFIIFFTNYRKIDIFSSIISTYSSVFDLEPHTNWDKFEESIADLKWKGNFNMNLTNGIMGEFTKAANDAALTNLIFDSTYNYDYKNLDITLFDIINRIIHDKNMILETGIQEVTPDEIREVRENRNKPKEEKETKQPENFNTPDGTVVIPAKAILAPVNGKAIYQLKIGDKIMARIEPKTDRAKYFIDLLGLWEEENKKVRPYPMSVVDIKAGPGKNDPIEILTEIGAGVYGKIIEEQNQVKLRIYDPQVDGVIAKNKLQPQKSTAVASEEKTSAKGIILMAALLIAIIGLFILLVFVF
jgi:hypothetical protein